MGLNKRRIMILLLVSICFFYIATDIDSNKKQQY